MSTTRLALDDVHRVRDACFCLQAQRTARALARRFDEALRPEGLTNGQFSLLMMLARPDPWNVGEAAAMLAMDRTTLTAALKPLTRRGLAAVAPDPDDRRGRLITLTPHGHAVMARALPIWERVHAELEGVADASVRAGMRALERAA